MTRSAFRALVETELTKMGWPPRSFLWAAPGKLVMVVKGELREFPIKANMKREKLQRQLGVLEGMAAILGLGHGAAN